MLCAADNFHHLTIGQSLNVDIDILRKGSIKMRSKLADFCSCKRSRPSSPAAATMAIKTLSLLATCSLTSHHHDAYEMHYSSRLLQQSSTMNECPTRNTMTASRLVRRIALHLRGQFNVSCETAHWKSGETTPRPYEISAPLRRLNPPTCSDPPVVDPAPGLSARAA